MIGYVIVQSINLLGSLYVLQLARRTSASFMGAFLEEYLVLRGLVRYSVHLTATAMKKLFTKLLYILVPHRTIGKKKCNGHTDGWIEKYSVSPK